MAPPSDTGQTVRLILGDDYHLGETWRNADASDERAGRGDPDCWDWGIYEIPVTQYERWQQAAAAMQQAQAEVREIMEARRKGSLAHRPQVKPVNPAMFT